MGRSQNQNQHFCTSKRFSPHSACSPSPLLPKQRGLILSSLHDPKGYFKMVLCGGNCTLCRWSSSLNFSCLLESQASREVLAWPKSSWHFAMPPLVSLQNDVWRMNEKHRTDNSSLSTIDLVKDSDWLKQISFAARPVYRISIQMWLLTHHQYGISALVSQTSFCSEISIGVTKCQLFSQSSEVSKLLNCGLANGHQMLAFLWVKVSVKTEKYL